MEILKITDGLYRATLAKWVDIDNGAIINGTFYNKQNWAPYPKDFTNLPGKADKLITGRYNLRSKQAYIIDPSEYAPATTPTVDGPSSHTPSFTSENVIRCNVDPNTKYVFLDYGGQSLTRGTSTSYYTKTLAKITTGEIGNFPNITTIDIENPGMNSLVYKMVQSENHIYAFTSSYPGPGGVASIGAGMRIWKVDKQTLETTFIDEADNFWFSAKGNYGSSSGRSGFDIAGVSIISDTATSTVFHVNMLFQYIYSTSASRGQWYNEVFILDKISGVVTHISKPADAAPSLSYNNSNLVNISSSTALYMSTCEHSFSENGKDYIVYLASPAVSADITTIIPHLIEFEGTSYVSNPTLTVDWGASGLTSIPILLTRYSTSTSSSTIHLLSKANHKFFFTKSGGNTYLNMAVKCCMEQDITGIYTFLLDTTTRTLTWVSTSKPTGNVLVDLLSLDNMQDGGNNTKIVVDAYQHGYAICIFNQETQSWQTVTRRYETNASTVVDFENTILFQRDDNSVHAESLSNSVTLEFEYEFDSYQYEGTEINSYITAKAVNYLNEIVEKVVEFTIDGPAVWTTTNSKQIQVALPENNTLDIPFTITGREGTIAIYGKAIGS